MGIAGANLRVRRYKLRTANECDAMIAPQTFVLVHGAWHGGWCWRRVAEALRTGGHVVFTPTLTGLGERVHLLHPGLTIEEFATDLANVLGTQFGGLLRTPIRRYAFFA